MARNWKAIFDSSQSGEELRKLRELNLRSTLESPPPEDFWRPTQEADDHPDITKHIEDLRLLRAPASEPAMGLFRLGTFSEDKALEERVEDIFCGKNTFLVNASGTGKTRLLYEGLCVNWGIYFTSTVDSTGLGLGDIQGIIGRGGALDYDKHFVSILDPISVSSSEFVESLRRNLQLAHQHLSIALLSRLVVFKTFLETAAIQGNPPESRQLWLRWQLGILSKVPKVAQDLRKSFAESAGNTVDDALVDVLDGIRSLSPSNGDKFFVVLDEANYASQCLDFSFCDETGSESSYYPALKVILRTWIKHLAHHPFTFVVAGTEIPRRYFTEADEWGDWVWSSNTGGFDERDTLQAYASSLLPPQYISTSGGKQFLQRLWLWTRGRHRFTASLMSVLIERSFVEPHSQFDGYIGALTGGYTPEAAEDEDELSWVEPMPFQPLDFDALEFHKVLASCIHETLIAYLLDFDEQIIFSEAEVLLVSRALGRFVDNRCSRIIVDEPFVVAGAALWFSRQKHSMLDFEHFSKTILHPDISATHTASYAIVCLTALFHDSCSLKNLFSIRSPASSEDVDVDIVTSKTLRKRRKAEVEWHFAKDFSLRIATWSRTIDSTLSWIRRRPTPFCIHLFEREPAIVFFVLKTSGGRRFWVFLRVVPPETPAEEVTRLADSCHPHRIFKQTSEAPSPSIPSESAAFRSLQKLPSLYPGVGTSGVLRVLCSFTDELDISHIPSDDTSSLAILKNDTVRNSTQSCAADETFMETLMETLIKNCVETKPSPKAAKKRPASSSPTASVEPEEIRPSKRASKSSIRQDSAEKGKATGPSSPKSVGSTTAGSSTGLRRSERLARSES
ncbi:hypothetical protein AAF712_015917 [Marasmius tenuissimus]|uniref:Uncharacterized protein n=1 Tax=Marasmius tenuissimus TaxID=585030 RepID=A0ABR2Z869_9AGAR